MTQAVLADIFGWHRAQLKDNIDLQSKRGACLEATPTLPLGGRLVRVVESQEQVATTVLVDGDLAQQDTLERLTPQHTSCTANCRSSHGLRLQN